MTGLVVQARTCFGDILRRTVEMTPSAVGGSLADRHGELVDAFARGYSALDWAILTAHYGVILALLHDAFGVLHHGGPEYFVAQHDRLAIVVHAVDRDYFALLAVADPNSTNRAVSALGDAAVALRREMA